jgi:hypothetical protein
MQKAVKAAAGAKKPGHLSQDALELSADRLEGRKRADDALDKPVRPSSLAKQKKVS